MNNQEAYNIIVDYLKHLESSVIKNNQFFITILSLLGITYTLNIHIFVQEPNIAESFDIKWSDYFLALVCVAWYLSNKFYDTKMKLTMDNLSMMENKLGIIQFGGFLKEKEQSKRFSNLFKGNTCSLPLAVSLPIMMYVSTKVFYFLVINSIQLIKAVKELFY
jgi:hypothetical protein